MAMVRFGDVAERVNTKEDRYNTDLEFYVGGDHIESNALTVSGRGRIKEADLGPMFYFGFKPGDILFVTRNPHLRKSAKVDFPGICSEKTLVIATKDENVLMQNYLAGVMQSDDFWDFMEGNKSGSVNFFINWSTLADYEFDLPPLDRQRELAELLWAANDLKEKYKKLITASDEMLKAKFREMFGEEDASSNGYRVDTLSNLLVIERGGSPRPISKFITDDPTGINWIKIGDVAVGDKYITKTAEKIIPEGERKSRRVYPGDFLLSNSMSFGRPYILKIEGCIHDGWLVLRDEKDHFDKMFLYYLLQSDDARRFFESMASGSTVKNLNKEWVGALRVCVPPLDLQRQFVEIAAQEEKVKANLKKSIADVDNIIKGLING